MCTTALAIHPWALSPYFLMYGRQPQLPIDVALGLTSKSIAVPTSSKHIQTLRVKWAYKKSIFFQQSEA